MSKALVNNVGLIRTARASPSWPPMLPVDRGETASVPKYGIDMHIVHFLIQSNPESVNNVYVWSSPI